MKICDLHQSRLEALCAERNMTHLVNRSPLKAAMQRAYVTDRPMLESKDANSPLTFDPMRQAIWMIHQHAVKMGGMYLFGKDKKGQPYCPVCEAVKTIPKLHRNWPAAQVEAHWTIGIMDNLLGRARDLGLMMERVTI